MTNVNKSKAELGRLGGLATLKKYGRRHFQRLGKWGAHRMHATYKLVPVDLNDFLLVNRETGEAKARLSGKPLK